MKKLLCVLLCVLMLISLAACAKNNPDDTPENNTDTITIVDHGNNTVTVPRDIKRVVVCDIFPLPSVLTVFFDSADKLIGIAPTSMAAAKNGLLSELYPEILNAKTDFMTGNQVNTEELAKLQPDVVFYSANNTKQGETLRTAGFNAVGISANNWGYNAIETLNQWIALLSQMFPDNNRADIVKSYSEQIFNMVKERTSGIDNNDKARVFFLFQYNDSSILTSGKQFFGEWWAEAIGAVNVAEELEKDNSVAVNLEQIYNWNPGVVFITNFTSAQPDDLYENKIGTYDWSGIDAVVNRQVYKMPLGMYRSYTPGVDTPITLLWLAKAVYPELFSDIDITAQAVEYYKTVFGVELTRGQVDSIFAPISAAGNIDYNG
ncbi:MAG: ABC transporter substrate-binding protein [Eubacteriales bacterium]|nr:ABC transporter substrate-binding protein [Eubacteriales bacterium]